MSRGILLLRRSGASRRRRERGRLSATLRSHRKTLRDVAYLDDRSLRELSIVATHYLRAWHRFPFD